MCGVIGSCNIWIALKIRVSLGVTSVGGEMRSVKKVGEIRVEENLGDVVSQRRNGRN